jgi:hypothetical protein
MEFEEEEAVTPCTRDYVATNGWLSKGRNRLTSGTSMIYGRSAPKKKKSSLQRDPEGPSQPMFAPGPNPCPALVTQSAPKKRVRYKETTRGQKKRKRVRYKEDPRGPANPMFAPGPNPCPALVTQSATNLH